VPSRHSGLLVTLVSIVWPYWERFEATFAGLRNMAASYPSADVEVVIVDDGSPTQPAAALGHFPAPWPVRVITLPRKYVPKNPCVPLNTGVKHARGDVILLTNPETTHRQPLMGPMLEELERRGPKTYVLAAVWCPETKEWHCHGRHAPVGYHFCAMLRKELYWAAGGFGEEYREGAGYDDPDFVFRLKAAGANFVFRDDLVADHHKTGARIDWPPGSFERNRGVFYSKWKLPRTVEADALIQNSRGGVVAPWYAELAERLTIARGVLGRRGGKLARRLGRVFGLTYFLRRGKKTVLHVDRIESYGTPQRLHEALNTWSGASWRSLGWLRFGGAFDSPPGQDLGIAREADVLHFHGLELWERVRDALPRRPTVVTVHGEWDRMCLPLSREVLLTITRPDLRSLFPGARYIPDLLLEREVPATIARVGPASLIHPTGELTGDLEPFEAFRASTGVRVFVQPVLNVREEPSVLLDKIRFFDACWTRNFSGSLEKIPCPGMPRTFWERDAIGWPWSSDDFATSGRRGGGRATSCRIGSTFTMRRSPRASRKAEHQRSRKSVRHSRSLSSVR
jgi:hypothetical protein